MVYRKNCGRYKKNVLNLSLQWCLKYNPL